MLHLVTFDGTATGQPSVERVIVEVEAPDEARAVIDAARSVALDPLSYETVRTIGRSE